MNRIPNSKITHRPWGNYKQFTKNEASTVQLITIQPHQRISLHAHERRAELWTILDAGAMVEMNDDVSYPKPGDEIWIKPGTKHRVSSTGDMVRVLELAFGEWDIDDIIRYDENYQA